MNAAQFTDAAQPLLNDALPDLKAKHYSDVVDAEGHQYVDLVMGGGGVLGIALVGYTYALEQAGIRFLRVGGTSAGSINALAIAGLDTPDKPKSEKLIGHLANMDVWSFVDGPASSKSLIKDFLHADGLFWKAFDTARAYNHFSSKLGLNPGIAFVNWLTGVMKSANINTLKDLRARMRTPIPGLGLRDGTPWTVDKADAKLAVVTADISTESKVILPEMARDYWPDPDAVEPALFVRASMSIPFFYEPLRVQNAPAGNPPERAFVDGGVLSNFPIDLFHETSSVPAAPTFGAKLGADGPPAKHIDSLVQLTMSVFNSARHALDNDFLRQNPDYRALVCTVDTGTQSWLNFDLKEGEKVDLFVRGVKSAIEFLKTFEWDEYKKFRGKLAAAHNAAPPGAPA